MRKRFMTLVLAGTLSLVAVSAVSAESPVPAAGTTPTATGTTEPQKQQDIPWGLAGLLGLVGLMGMNRNRDHARSHQGQQSNPARS